MAENLLLIFAYHYPPENAIGAARPFRFAKYLARIGYTCRVFTAADQRGRHEPDTEYVPDAFVTNSRRSVKWQLERAVRKLLLPGELGIQWSHAAYKAARARVLKHSGARITILSTSPPLGPHLAAWRLARDFDLTWIADFRDPFTDEGHARRIQRRQIQVRNWLERTFLQEADAVIANTDAAMISLQDRFPVFRQKIHSIWNGFDPENRVPPLPSPVRDYKILSHVGELYNGRKPAPILDSISRLIRAGRLKGNVRVRLIGKIEDATTLCPEVVRRGKTEGWLELIPEQIPQQEARRVAQTSDGLLLLQSRTTLHVPAKIFEYLQIGRPILASITPGSPSEHLLKQSGVRYLCVYPNNTREEIDEIVVRFFNLPSAPVAPSQWFEEKFNVENQTRTLDHIIRQLHGEPCSQREHRSIRAEALVPSWKNFDSRNSV